MNQSYSFVLANPLHPDTTAVCCTPSFYLAFMIGFAEHVLRTVRPV
jgi:hypothetical protein